MEWTCCTTAGAFSIGFCCDTSWSCRRVISVALFPLLHIIFQTQKDVGATNDGNTHADNPLFLASDLKTATDSFSQLRVKSTVDTKLRRELERARALTRAMFLSIVVIVVGPVSIRIN